MVLKNNLPELVFLSVPEASRLCGVTRNTMYTWVRKGHIKAYQTPGHTNLIRPSDLIEFMRQSGMFVPDALVEMARQDENADTSLASVQLANPEFTTILAVDDDASCRRVVVRALEKEYNVLQAETGFQALHLLTLHEEISLMILDLRMPGQHGLETLKEIQHLRPDVKIIILSGYAGEARTENMADLPVVCILNKPCSAANLRAAVHRVLPEA